MILVMNGDVIIKVIAMCQLSWYLLAQSQPWKQMANAWNLFKVDNVDDDVLVSLMLT